MDLEPKLAQRSLSHMADLIDTIRTSVIGRDTAVLTPFGLRRVTYADYTASGRSLDFIEEFIRNTVLPLYANTHTETSGTGLQTTRFREDARAIIRHAVGGSDEHAVIFAGSGSTGAIDRLITILGFRIPAGLDDRFGLTALIPPEDRPVVFVGPYEHHSNELPWRESIADVVEIAEDSDGHIDMVDLERRLIEFSGRPLRIGSFSAASNVTGIITDTSTVVEPAPSARGPLVLGLRGGRPVRRDRDAFKRGQQPRLQGRHLHLPAQVHRRTRHSRRSGRSQGPAAQPRPLDSRAAAPSRTSMPASTTTWSTPSTARREEHRRSSNRSGPGSSSN